MHQEVYEIAFTKRTQPTTTTVLGGLCATLFGIVSSIPGQDTGSCHNTDDVYTSSNSTTDTATDADTN